jgi:hypothetical protein
MIISHKHRYLFIELPRTGSTAIAHELLRKYDGEKIAKKHSTYLDFLRHATPEESTYFVFSCIRNPLDDAVSCYFKARNDHRSQFTRPGRHPFHRGLARLLADSQYRFLQTTHADFPTFLKKYYVLPYSNWSVLSHKKFDYIIRFENLQADFDQVLRLIGIEPVRPLPVVNKTDGKDADFVRYYTPEVIGHAKRVFGAYMRLWGYEFPPEWGDHSVSRRNQLAFDCANLLRQPYWRYLRSYI